MAVSILARVSNFVTLPSLDMAATLTVEEGSTEVATPGISKDSVPSSPRDSADSPSLNMRCLEVSWTSFVGGYWCDRIFRNRKIDGEGASDAFCANN